MIFNITGTSFFFRALGDGGVEIQFRDGHKVKYATIKNEDWTDLLVKLEQERKNG